MKNSLVLTVLVYLFSGSAVYADMVSTFGDQDFVEGTVLFNNAEFLAPQNGEPSPIGIHTDPSTFSWTHTFTPHSGPSVLAISLWDLDANFVGNQVSAFSVNGIAQDVSVFEAFQDGDRVHLYNAVLADGLLSSGSATVSLTLGNLESNAVGFDFARITAVPESSSLACLAFVFVACVFPRSRMTIAPDGRLPAGL